MPSREQTEHQKWCEEQHSSVNGKMSKIYTRLGKMETHIEAHATCAEEVRKELKSLNAWALKRDGATKALMWVAGIGGTIIALTTAVYKLSS